MAKEMGVEREQQSKKMGRKRESARIKRGG